MKIVKSILILFVIFAISCGALKIFNTPQAAVKTTLE